MMFRGSAILLAFAVLFPLPTFGQKVNKQDVQDWIRVAAKVTNPREAGSAPFRLRARVRFHFNGADRELLDGTYTLLWHSPEQWKEEVVFPEYRQISVARTDRIWLQRSLPFLPLRVHELRGLVNFSRLLKPKEKDRVRRIRQEKRPTDGLCTNVERGGYMPRRICFDPAAHLPISVKWRSAGRQGGETFYEFSEYRTQGSKQFPTTLRFGENSKVRVEVWVEDFSELQETPDEDTRPLGPEVEVWDWCPEPEAAKLVKSVDFYYPMPSGISNWRTSVYGVIDTDGRLKNIHLLEPTPQPIEDLIRNKSTDLLYEPASCRGKPIKTEIVFSLGRWTRP